MNLFSQLANRVSKISGHATVFAGAVLVIVIWAVSGPFFGFSDTWQLIINTGTTILTFLMVFLIQNTQNRNDEAMQLKLDELLRALDAADTELCNLEERGDEELQRLHERYVRLADLHGRMVKARAQRKMNKAQAQ